MNGLCTIWCINMTMLWWAKLKIGLPEPYFYYKHLVCVTKINLQGYYVNQEFLFSYE